MIDTESVRGKRFNIKNIRISIVSLADTLEIIDDSILKKQYGYICVTEERTTYIANHDPAYCAIQNNALLTLPDGMPLVWIAHNLGHKHVERISGPDLLNALLNISETKNYSHFFYGSTPQTIGSIRERLDREYPGMEIKGTISPPFQPLELFDIEHIANEVNRLEPTFFWCGLGAPKQEKFIALLQPKLKSTICIGVGLAFDYYANSVKRAPVWAQKRGLEGFFRLSQQPKRINLFLIRRYLYWIRVVIFTKLFGKII